MTEPRFSPTLEPLEFVRIEAEAHRLRAETIRDGARWMVARVAALWAGAWADKRAQGL